MAQVGISTTVLAQPVLFLMGYTAGSVVDRMSPEADAESTLLVQALESGLQIGVLSAVGAVLGRDVSAGVVERDLYNGAALIIGLVASQQRLPSKILVVRQKAESWYRERQRAVKQATRPARTAPLVEADSGAAAEVAPQ